MTQIFGNLIYAFLWLVGACVFYLPFSLKKAVADGLALIWFYGVGFRKKIILHNLIKVFPRESGETMDGYRERLNRLCLKNIQHYCLSFLETLERFHWTPEVVQRRVHIIHPENLDKLLKSKRGFFVLSSHIGNWELMTLVGVKIGVPLAILTKFLRNGFWDQIWVKSRKSFGLELIKERNSGLEIARCVQKGKAVGFILDQHTGEPHGIESQFMEQKAWTAKGLAILSIRLKAAVIPGFLIRRSDGDFELHCETSFMPEEVIPQEFRVESGPVSSEALEFHVRKCNEIMEKWSYQYPEQYLWLHKRFKNIFDYKSPLPW